MADWRDELALWLTPFIERFGHKARRRMCPLYVAGLIGPGDRKSVGPMAERVAPGDYDRLHHFVADGVWDEAPLERELAIQANKPVGGAVAFLVIDDTPLPKNLGASSGAVRRASRTACSATSSVRCIAKLACRKTSSAAPSSRAVAWGCVRSARDQASCSAAAACRRASTPRATSRSRWGRPKGRSFPRARGEAPRLEGGRGG